MDSGFTDSISARYNDGGISDSLPCKRRDPCWESLQITIQQLSARDSGCCWSPWVGQHFLSYVRQQETLTQQHMIKPNESSFLQNMMSGIFRNANYGVFIYLKNIHKKNQTIKIKIEGLDHFYYFIFISLKVAPLWHISHIRGTWGSWSEDDNLTEKRDD